MAGVFTSPLPLLVLCLILYILHMRHTIFRTHGDCAGYCPPCVVEFIIQARLFPYALEVGDPAKGMLSLAAIAPPAPPTPHHCAYYCLQHCDILRNTSYWCRVR